MEEHSSSMLGATELMLKCIDPMTPPSQEISALLRDQDQEEVATDEEEEAHSEIRAIAEVLKKKLAAKAEKLRLL